MGRKVKAMQGGLLQLIRNEEEMEQQKLYNREDTLITRSENFEREQLKYRLDREQEFEREMVGQKVQAINNLANSISGLSLALMNAAHPNMRMVSEIPTTNQLISPIIYFNEKLN